MSLSRQCSIVGALKGLIDASDRATLLPDLRAIISPTAIKHGRPAPFDSADYVAESRQARA